ncbi:protein P-30-like [Bufo gargarizans]|uniref:protein P-30-like n=1 Tax=Bufo gargarizans TaxID=30331 RepID=UPI001CF4D4A0|nr:protein P-30-like [Bufo gargarizans]
MYVPPQTSSPEMSSTSPMLLLVGFLLSLPNLNLSAGEKWVAFKENHITSSMVVNCDVVMAGECKEAHSFIHTNASILEKVCQYITGAKNISRSKEFTVSTCEKQQNANTTCSYGEAKVQKGAICLTCRNRKPVEFVKMGSC